MRRIHWLVLFPRAKHFSLHLEMGGEHSVRCCSAHFVADLALLCLYVQGDPYGRGKALVEALPTKEAAGPLYFSQQLPRPMSPEEGSYGEDVYIWSRRTDFD